MKRIDKELETKIPIRVSVEQLDEQFPHLRGIQWNAKDDEKEEDLNEEPE